MARSIDRFISFNDGSDKSIHLQILHGDITTEDTRGLVVFRDANDGNTDGDSLRVLNAAGPAVDTEYQRVRNQGGRDVSRGVVLTGAGNLVKASHILHVHLVDQNYGQMREAIITALRTAENLALKSLAFPSVPDHLSQDVVDQFIKNILESVEQFATLYRPIFLQFIQIVIYKSDGNAWRVGMVFAAFALFARIVGAGAASPSCTIS